MTLRYVWSGASGANDGTSWANAWTSYASAVSGASAGDVVLFADDHSQTTTTGLEIDLSIPGNRDQRTLWISVNRTSGLPSFGALIATGVNTKLKLRNTVTFKGIEFRLGVGSTGGDDLTINGDSRESQIFEDCKITFATTGGAQLRFNSECHSTWKGCTFKFGATNQKIAGYGRSEFIGCSIDPAGTIPDQLFTDETTNATFKSCDLSALVSKIVMPNNGRGGLLLMERCLIPASFTIMDDQTANGIQSMEAVAFDCSDGANFNISYKKNSGGEQNTDKLVYLTAGASNGAENWSDRLQMKSGYASLYAPFNMIPIFKHNATVGSNLTLTLEGLLDGAALPTDAEVWLDAKYPGSSSNPLGTVKSGGISNYLGTPTALSASSASWTAPLRTNGMSVVAGQAFRVSSNSGRVFIAQGSGTLLGSLPGGYATAVDGDTVSDNGVSCRAAMRFSVSVTLTSPQPQVAGPISLMTKVAKDNALMWFDRKVA